MDLSPFFNIECTYVLELTDNKYYVGKTKDIKNRIENHFTTGGSSFTKIYKPLKIVLIRHQNQEKELTIEYMKKYGWQNVRGYSWSQVNLKNKPKCLT